MDRFNDLFIDEDVNNYASNYLKFGDFYTFFSRPARVFATFYAEYVFYAAAFDNLMDGHYDDMQRGFLRFFSPKKRIKIPKFSMDT